MKGVMKGITALFLLMIASFAQAGMGSLSLGDPQPLNVEGSWGYGQHASITWFQGKESTTVAVLFYQYKQPVALTWHGNVSATPEREVPLDLHQDFSHEINLFGSAVHEGKLYLATNQGEFRLVPDKNNDGFLLETMVYNRPAANAYFVQNGNLIAATEYGFYRHTSEGVEPLLTTSLSLGRIREFALLPNGDIHFSSQVASELFNLGGGTGTQASNSAHYFKRESDGGYSFHSSTGFSRIMIDNKGVIWRLRTRTGKDPYGSSYSGDVLEKSLDGTNWTEEGVPFLYSGKNIANAGSAGLFVWGYDPTYSSIYGANTEGYWFMHALPFRDATSPYKVLSLPGSYQSPAYYSVSGVPGGILISSAHTFFIPILEEEDPENYLVGDANGDGRVTVTDVTLLLRASVGTHFLAPKEVERCDLDNDGHITLKEVIAALQVAIGVSESVTRPYARG